LCVDSDISGDIGDYFPDDPTTDAYYLILDKHLATTSEIQTQINLHFLVPEGTMIEQMNDMRA